MRQVAERSGLKSSFIPVSVKTLQPSEVLAVSLFLQDDGSSYRLYRDRYYPLTRTDLDRLLQRGHRTLFMEASDHAYYQQYLRDNLDSILTDESIVVDRRFSALNEVVRDVLADSFRSDDVDSTIESCKSMAEHSVGLICREDAVAAEMMDVMYHDYHTFTHSANVAYYAVILAKSLGIFDDVELQRICVGGLLHDIGKLGVSDKILTKPGRLTEEEFDLIKDHPRLGLLQLRSRIDLSYGQLMMVYQHHERMDGSGYPVGSVGSELHDYGKLCAVVDVYEALTSNRPYRPKMSTKKAFEIMERDAGRALNEEMLRCWKSTIR